MKNYNRVMKRGSSSDLNELGVDRRQIYQEKNAQRRDLYSNCHRHDLVEDFDFNSLLSREPKVFLHRYKMDDYIRPMFNEAIAISNHMSMLRIERGHGHYAYSPNKAPNLDLGAKVRIKLAEHALDGKIGTVVEYDVKRQRYLVSSFLRKTAINVWVGSADCIQIH
jgi:hypothetical protein